MTANKLHSYTCKDLAQMARNEGVTGWHAMRKDELIEALIKTARRSRRTGGDPAAKGERGREVIEGSRSEKLNREESVRQAGKISAKRRQAQKQLDLIHQKMAKAKDLSCAAGDQNDEASGDRLVMLVRDPYWLHAHWEIAPSGVQRAKSSLGQFWHAAHPVLRVLQVDESGATLSRREIRIHGGVSNWYIDVADPPCQFRAEVGYAVEGGDFYCLARSNTVTTPAPGSADMVDTNWSDVAEKADQIYAMSGGYSHGGVSIELQELLEERLRRRLGRPSQTRYGHAVDPSRGSEMELALDAELVVYGSSDPHSHVTVMGEPVAVGDDGSFVVKMHLPDRRQVIPVVASSADGVQQRTVILGVERNTKELDPRYRDVATS
ncbi:DUF4912 domain-containing protein [Pseudobythopirellula maris]|nr:DUF4912 domain-containing protein [Pseudobythopirellula maris]